MDLDKIQKSWAKIDIPISIDVNSVKEIISGKVRTALDRLIMTETIFLFIIIPLLGVPFIIDYLLKEIYTIPSFIKLGYLVFCVTGFFWQVYKRQLLKRIDIANVGIMNNRRYFLKYKLCIKYEIIVGTSFGLVLFISIVYSWKGIMTDYQFELYCLINIALCILIVLQGAYLYRRIYYKRIKEIESSLDEIDNIEE